MNSKNIFTGAMILMALQLAGCAGNIKQQTPAPIVDETLPETMPPVQPIAVEQPIVQPVVKPAAPIVINNAAASLLNQARAQYRANNYQGAVATAERALRIDRRSPEVYLILAQSYVQLANKQLALQFVQQGIRYAQAGSEMAQSLIGLRDSLSY